MSVSKKVLKLLFIFLNVSIHSVSAYPYIGFPFSQQLPDIARIGEDYKFIINSQTFESDDESSIQYKAFNLPAWLDFNPSTLELSGLPDDNNTSSNDLGVIDFILQGTDSKGSLNQSCSIYLSNQASPELNPNDSIISQLKSIGSTNGYDGIVFNPETSFKITFDSDTFQIPSSSSNKIVEYYGKSANRTSLPSWCFFDSDSLTFSGVTPPVNSVNAPSLEFDLTLIATDYDGYSAAYADFTIVVGGHDLYLNSSSYNNTVTTNPGDSFSIDLPLEYIYLDDSMITVDQIKSVNNYDGPSWIQIDDNSKLSGTVPSDQTSNVLVNVTLFDIYGDSVFMEFDIDVLHEIFNVDSISNITVTDGQFFQFTLPDSYFKNKTDTKLDVIFEDTWLTFYYSNNTFTGQVPQDFTYSEIELDATMNSMEQTLKFYIIGKPLTSSSIRQSSSSSRSSTKRSSRTSSYSTQRFNSTKSFTSSASVTSYSSSSVPTYSSSLTSSFVSSASSATTSGVLLVPDNSNKSTESENKKKLAIGLGVAIPLVVIIVGVISFYFCFCVKRRKNNQDDENPDSGTGSGAYTMNKRNSTSSTLTINALSTRMLAEKNLTNLEKNGDDASSFYSTTQSTLTDESNPNLYQSANHQTSTDQLLGDINLSNNASGIFNSWRKSSNGNLKTRDSLNSLATVATNELLTVNVINDNKLRKSQMIFPKMTSLRNLNNSSDSMFDMDKNSNNRVSDNNLTTLREEEHNSIISRDRSYETISSEAQLVGFENKKSISKNIQREKKSYRGELYNIGSNDDDDDDDEDYDDDDNNNREI